MDFFVKEKKTKYVLRSTGPVTAPGQRPGAVFSRVFFSDQPLLLTKFYLITAPGRSKPKVGEIALYECKAYSSTRFTF